MNNEFDNIIEELINNDKVLSMKEYRQHFDINCFDHCYDVAKTCYKINKKLKLDYISATRAAMLHDLFLYDWHLEENRHKGHAYRHPKIACDNASKIFKLNDKEKDMILKHMWPTTIIPPKSREGFVLTVVDKYCTVKESFNYLSRTTANKKIIRYAVFIMQMLLVRL